MKKIIAFVAIIATLTTLLAMPVAAAEIFYHDFENPPESGSLKDVGDGTVWKPYSESMSGVVTFEDGAVKIEQAGTTAKDRHFWNVHYNVSGQDHVLKFDIKAEMANPSLSTQFFMGGTRVIWQQLGIMQKADTWYSIMIVVTDGATKATLYYCERDAENPLWTKLNLSSDNNGTRGEHTRTDFKMGFDSSTKPVQTGTIWYDNYMVYEELWFDNQNISLEGEPVETIADVTSGGTLSFDFDLYDANISFNTDKTIAENVTAKTVIVALDKNMKMVACSTVNIPLKGHLNTVSASLELSDDEDAANYYGNLTDGGQINFYMWNNMQPLCDPIVIE